MAESSLFLEAYQAVHKLFSQSSFDKNELTIVWRTINKEHSCHYCLPAHTAVAQMMEADDGVNGAVRNDTALPNEKYEMLRSTTLAMVRQRSVLATEQIEAFYSAGYENKHL